MPKKCKLLVRKVYSLGSALQLIKATAELQQKLLPRVAERERPSSCQELKVCL